MVEKIEELRAKKEGKVTPKALINNLLLAIEKDEVEGVVFVAKDKDGLIRTGWSDFESTEAIGLLECGKEIINDMYEQI
ncbi:hypothetical protein [Brevibacillus laterosporus]|uniref:hypothetical protein n=1 Tax=Brevibacillus laterosporus TaxID=1465 RepID=UPI000E6B9777|nr:hypothetical protein [Brevibacillus laterosporus]AYB38540.1 hypothetical protein D5F52_09860 [Brevibacillus laterosporus]MBM7110721.1 hypothetical protein [Brevibacillus laterosporus]